LEPESQSLFARLLEAQEEERSRIARELHDDIGASLAVLAVELLRASQPFESPAGDVHPGIPEIYEEMQLIAKRVSRLSHQLHSPALEYLGLAKAIQIECREFSERHPIPVTCSSREVPLKLDRLVALSLLRVAQEALQNAAKHSAAAKIAVEVAVDAGVLTLLVRDDGRGFDVEQSSPQRLGLICMRERMRMVDGEFEIRSQAGQGTEVICRVPLARATHESA
jgi:signal transduction histidine kinase